MKPEKQQIIENNKNSEAMVSKSPYFAALLSYLEYRQCVGNDYAQKLESLFQNDSRRAEDVVALYKIINASEGAAELAMAIDAYCIHQIKTGLFNNSRLRDLMLLACSKSKIQAALNDYKKVDPSFVLKEDLDKCSQGQLDEILQRIKEQLHHAVQNKMLSKIKYLQNEIVKIVPESKYDNSSENCSLTESIKLVAELQNKLTEAKKQREALIGDIKKYVVIGETLSKDFVSLNQDIFPLLPSASIPKLQEWKNNLWGMVAKLSEDNRYAALFTKEKFLSELQTAITKVFGLEEVNKVLQIVTTNFTNANIFDRESLVDAKLSALNTFVYGQFNQIANNFDSIRNEIKNFPVADERKIQLGRIVSFFPDPAHVNDNPPPPIVWRPGLCGIEEKHYHATQPPQM